MAINLNGNTGFGINGAANSLGLVGSSIGLKATSPNNNIIKSQNTLSPQQTAPKDLSGTFAKSTLNGNPTIYNKSTGQAYSDPQSFFRDAGVGSFDNLKFDTNWSPQPAQPQQQPQQQPQYAQQPQSQNQVQAFSTPATPANLTPSAGSSNYTPPNQGTTGVSQGGIIGNLINYGNSESPEVLAARKQLQDLQSQQADKLQQLGGSGIDQSLYTGDAGLLNNLFASKEAAAQTGVANALQSQQQRISATQDAGNLNAPVIANPGQIQINPSQPTPGATTSGASNLNSLLHIVNVNGNPTYQTSSGQNFSNPQQLADFVNQQQPGANVNASNVFDYIKNNGQGGSNILGGNSALNPLNNVQSTAQAVANGTLGYQDALTAGGNIPNYANVLQQAIHQISPNFNFNTSQGNSQAQTLTAAQQAQQQAQYTSSKQQANNLSQQFNNLLGTYGLNPNDLNIANGVVQKIAANTSDWRYQALNNYITDIVNTYAQILTPPGATTTDYTKTQAANMLNNLASGQSLQNTIASIDNQAQAKIAGVQTTPITNSQGNNSPSGLYNF